jgi:hypothetical protein
MVPAAATDAYSTANQLAGLMRAVRTRPKARIEDAPAAGLPAPLDAMAPEMRPAERPAGMGATGGLKLHQLFVRR